MFHIIDQSFAEPKVDDIFTIFIDISGIIK